MAQVFFFSPDGYSIMKDARLRELLRQSHGWQSDGAAWVFGVAVPRESADPREVAAGLAELGALVLPDGDDATPLDGEIVAALASLGVVETDRAADVASKVYAASGMPTLRPQQ